MVRSQSPLIRWHSRDLSTAQNPPNTHAHLGGLTDCLRPPRKPVLWYRGGDQHRTHEENRVSVPFCHRYLSATEVRRKGDLRVGSRRLPSRDARQPAPLLCGGRWILVSHNEIYGWRTGDQTVGTKQTPSPQGQRPPESVRGWWLWGLQGRRGWEGRGTHPHAGSRREGGAACAKSDRTRRPPSLTACADA